MTKKPKEHYSYAHIAGLLADNGWGRTFETDEKAMEGISPTVGVGDAVLLEMLRMVRHVISSASKDIQRAERSRIFEKTLEKPPDYAVRIPEIKIGDMLWCCDELDSGPNRAIVVHVDHDGFAAAVYVNEADDDCSAYIGVHWVTSHWCRTPDEALRKEALSDVGWYAPNLSLAKAVLDAPPGMAEAVRKAALKELQ